MIRSGLIACALLATVVSSGCKKAADKVPAAGSGSGSAAVAAPVGSGSAAAGSATAAADPWDSPAAHGQDMPDKVGEKTGAGLAAVEVKPVAGLAAKVELASIEKPVAKVAIQGFGAVKESGFRVTYNPSKNPAHEQYRDIFEKNKVFEKVAEGLNSTVRLPGTIDINTVDCGTINAFYDPNNKRIIVCYELLDFFIGVFKPHIKDETQLGNAVIGATMFTFFHETGHGLIDVLDLAAVGRQEDAVDQLATLILIAAGDEGVAMALSGAHWFQLQTKGGESKTPFWDEHSFDGQRFYNTICLIYGSNPEKYKAFVASGDLPEARAARCPQEYKTINKAWEKLLQPHFTNGAATNVDYKPSVPTTEAPQTTKKDPWGDDDSGDSTPTTEAPAPATQPAARTLTCETVATRAAELIGTAAQEQAKSMTPEQIEELKTRLETQLPAAIQQILATCVKDNWSDTSRKCVVDAKTLDEASKCN